MSSKDTDTLPDGQPAIQTYNSTRLEQLCTLARASRRMYPTMGLVTGSPGMGKTTAIHKYVSGHAPYSHTGLCPVVRVEVPDHPTRKSLITAILRALGETPMNENESYDLLIKEAVDAIKKNGIELMFLDEGDRLNDDTFECIRRIFDDTGCPIITVGLPAIKKVIDRHEKFSSRVSLRMEFLEPTLEEVSETILPQLAFPHWVFDPQCETDQALGHYIWERVRPSFRRLRDVLQHANELAEQYGNERIALEQIQAVLQLTGLPVRESEEPASRDSDGKSDYERRSEERQKAKQQRKKQTND